MYKVVCNTEFEIANDTSGLVRSCNDYPADQFIMTYLGMECLVIEGVPKPEELPNKEKMVFIYMPELDHGGFMLAQYFDKV